MSRLRYGPIPHQSISSPWRVRIVWDVYLLPLEDCVKVKSHVYLREVHTIYLSMVYGFRNRP